MDAHLILWPVFAQVLLTLLMYLVLAARKAKAIRDKAVDRQQVALDNRLWPEDTVKVSNNIAVSAAGKVPGPQGCRVFFFQPMVGRPR